VNASIRNVGPDGVEINVEQTLKAEDYRLFNELAEQRIDRFGQVNLLVVITGLAGWMPTDLWQDIKFDVDHYGDVGRLAIVGAVPLEHWMATLSKPFISAVVQYYPIAEIEVAREWIRDLPLESLAHRAWGGARLTGRNW
jgi:SpoIIAA-like